jgi:hypothetical protein
MNYVWQDLWSFKAAKNNWLRKSQKVYGPQIGNPQMLSANLRFAICGTDLRTAHLWKFVREFCNLWAKKSGRLSTSLLIKTSMSFTRHKNVYESIGAFKGISTWSWLSIILRKLQILRICWFCFSDSIFFHKNSQTLFFFQICYFHSIACL